jgi:hypothetical protein
LPAFVFVVAEGEIESSEDNLTDVEQGAGSDYSEPENEATDNADLPSVAAAVNTMLTAELNNTEKTLKEMDLIATFVPDLNIDVTKVTEEVDQIILGQTTLEQLRSNQEQTINDIQDIIKSAVIEENNLQAYENLFDEPAAQIRSELIQLFE